MHRGVYPRTFVRGFNLSDDVEVSNVEYKDGMLTVTLQKIIPDHQKLVYDITLYFSGTWRASGPCYYSRHLENILNGAKYVNWKTEMKSFPTSKIRNKKMNPSHIFWLALTVSNISRWRWLLRSWRHGRRWNGNDGDDGFDEDVEEGEEIDTQDQLPNLMAVCRWHGSIGYWYSWWTIPMDEFVCSSIPGVLFKTIIHIPLDFLVTTYDAHPEVETKYKQLIDRMAELEMEQEEEYDEEDVIDPEVAWRSTRIVWWVMSKYSNETWYLSQPTRTTGRRTILLSEKYLSDYWRWWGGSHQISKYITEWLLVFWKTLLW